MSVQLSSRDEGDYQLSGELTFDTVTSLYQRSDEIVAVNKLIDIDLRDVSRVDSAGLVLLVEWVRRATLQDQRLQFTGMSAQLEALVRINGLQDVIVSGGDH
ncbi:lipid asymmetry maintenance protein MlaB [Pseudomonadota bacterium]